MKQRSHPKIGLALSGGFVRGIAHIGVLKVLEDQGIPIHCVAGSSVGALIGAIYCSGVRAGEMAEIACCSRRRRSAELAISRYGFLSSRRMIKFLGKVLRASTFEELEIPLAVTATEISTGQPVVLRSGSLVDAVRASCAYPGVFPPVKAGGRLLMDGGLTHPVPIQPVHQMGPDRVIAVHLRTRTGLGGSRKILDVIGRCFNIVQQRSETSWRLGADLVVEPEVRNFRYNDFGRINDLLRAGEAAMRALLPEVLGWFEDKQTAEAVEPVAVACPDILL